MGLIKKLSEMAFKKKHPNGEVFNTEDIKKELSKETIDVVFPDGHVENYPKLFRITDGKNCVICRGIDYHTHLDCMYLQQEMERNPKVLAFTTKEANEQGMEQCFECKELDDLFKDED